MKTDSMIAYAEVDEILNLLENDYKEKVPQKVKDFFKEAKMQDYKVNIDVNIPLENQNLKRETMIILAILNLNYWCENEIEKQEFLNQLSENEKEKQKLEEKYDIENIFKQRTSNTVEESTEIIEYKKPNFIQTIIDRLLKMFRRK